MNLNGSSDNSLAGSEGTGVGQRATAQNDGDAASSLADETAAPQLTHQVPLAPAELEEEDDDSERKAIWQVVAAVVAVILIGATVTVSSLVSQQFTGRNGDPGETASATLEELRISEAESTDDDQGNDSSVDMLTGDPLSSEEGAPEAGASDNHSTPEATGRDSFDRETDRPDAGLQEDANDIAEDLPNTQTNGEPPVAVVISLGDDEATPANLTPATTSTTTQAPVATITVAASVSIKERAEVDDTPDVEADAQVDAPAQVTAPVVSEATQPLDANAPPVPDNVGCQYLGNDVDVQWVFSPLPALVDTYLVEFRNGAQQDVGRQPGPLTTTDNNLTKIIAVKDGIQSALTVGSCEGYGGEKPVAGAPGLPSGVKCRFHDFFYNANGQYTWSETWTWTAGADTDSYRMRINQDGTFIWVDNGASTTHTTVGVTGPQNTGRQLKGIIAVGPGGETELSTANCGAMDSSGWENP